MTKLRDPGMWLLLGLIVLLAPAAVGLVRLYERASARRAAAEMPVLPGPDSLLTVVHQFDPALSAPRLALAYQAHPEPRSGLVSLYRIYDGDRFAYRLAVVRHDIPCVTCRDLLAGIFLAPTGDQIAGIRPLAVWEMANGAIDPGVFLTQLAGRSLLDSLRVGGEIDGLTGASLSVQALLAEVGGLGRRMREILR